ncbi:MAG: hypothetical protein KAI50_01955 [Desulfobacterales bacterium]|nr:hypothetical protein [Desulfobacterales bacterium]
MKSNLPPGITFTKTRIQDQWVHFTFRHKDLGDIGRIRLKGTGNNTTINLDVIGVTPMSPIFADNAWTPDRLEDYAQMMYPNYSEVGLPTWIIGSPLNNLMDAPAYFLKVWPEREPVCLLTPDEFDPVICKIQESHCG